MVMRTAEEIILNGFKRVIEGQRGLMIAEPGEFFIKGHANKAEHNLAVMNDLKKLNHTDWAVIVGYYAMYHSSLSILSKIGLSSKDHTITSAALEYFFVDKGYLEREFITKFNRIKELKDLAERGELEKILIKTTYIEDLQKAKRMRETAQYGVKTSVDSLIVSEIVKISTEFVERMNALLSDLENIKYESFLKAVNQKIKELEETAHGSI